jgi:uncharacterized protein YlzI (FlbEa/FlbD family)
MQKTLGLLCILAALLVASACAATNYNITTLNGEKYISQEQPEYDEDSKTYTFRNMEGKKVILNQSEIKEIKSVQDE